MSKESIVAPLAPWGRGCHVVTGEGLYNHSNISVGITMMTEKLTVTSLDTPHPNPPPQVGREPKVCHPEFISGSQEKDLFTYLLILFRLSVVLLPKFQG